MTKQQKQYTIIAIVIVVLIVLIIVLPKEKPEEAVAPEEVVPEVEVSKEIPKAPEATEIIRQAKKAKEPIAVVEGASKVSGEGIVVTEEGETVKADAPTPADVDAPQQSKVLEEEEVKELEQESIQLTVDFETGFNPSNFSAKPGQVVTVVVTGNDDQTHYFRFKDPALRGVSMRVVGSESRAITFNAPDVPGEYEFLCSGHTNNPKETGIMYVTE